MRLRQISFWDLQKEAKYSFPEHFPQKTEAESSVI